MADAYWNRQQQPLQVPPSRVLKRPRPDYGHDVHNYLAHNDDRGRVQAVRDTNTIGSAYDRYLQSTQISSLNPAEVGNLGGGSGTAGGGGGGFGVIPSFSKVIPTTMVHRGPLGPDLVPISQNTGYGGQIPIDIMHMTGQEPVHLPPNASSTLYVEGLPSDTTKREVARILFHLVGNFTYLFASSCLWSRLIFFETFFSSYIDIFRPFVGYKEVRLVNKESKHRGGDPLIFCFVDFADQACAATAMGALQGYKMDEHDNDSACLRLQFARNPGPRSGPRPPGRR
ncbi:hypothetical protein SAY86_023470 [Trapa natans]|uniref:RRM domain-containing protein n=1 Tax=Trapa natans TaxID=22666 RepID=A0AAN7LV17_TRANT|nr:hypothetical protein SAY86_023470 [Trapa natans]